MGPSSSDRSVLVIGRRPFLGRVSGRRLCRQLGWYRGAVLRPLGCGSFFILSKLRRRFSMTQGGRSEGDGRNHRIPGAARHYGH
ncbi:protein of unknown function [Kyrpidia spormannii]|uniref:Uncharacterized protein n=1 Tax=Kyrpidia spormannii TaxID=2055160 RepID=A0ACA8Z7D6_9BACL|nr:protein of unknown function [Kyrpidia spormannii]